MRKKSSWVLITAGVMLLLAMAGCKGSDALQTGNEGEETQQEVQEDVATTVTNEKVPEVVIEEREIPQTEAILFVKDMAIGWNLGNTFDAYADEPWFEDEMDYETIWSGYETTEEMIQSLKEAGFNTLRLPVSWHNHVDEEYVISEPWLARVQEVVDYAIGQDMYVILNIHHDIQEGYYYPSYEQLETSTEYVKTIWEQLGQRFAEYDEHLIFESINEPRLKGTGYEWWLNMDVQECKDAVECINLLNQTFVDTVRATGGNNLTRYLMVPGYAASGDYAVIPEFRLPADVEENLAERKIIVSVHAYTPYSFALQSSSDAGSVSTFDSDNANDTKDIDALMKKLYYKFIVNEIPVVIGEFGARDKDNNTQDRVDYATYYIAAARASGITCCWWDNNAFSGEGENFGLLRRMMNSWLYPDIVDGLMKYAR